MKNKKYFIIGILFAICSFIAFWIGQQFPCKNNEKITIIRDTLIVRDTLTIKEPIEKIRWKEKDKFIYISNNDIDTIYKNDTIYLSLPQEKVEYNDKDYKVIISGIQPKLEEISVYPQTVYINEIQKKQIIKHWNFGINVGPGIFYNKKIDYGVGIIFGFGYNF